MEVGGGGGGGGGLWGGVCEREAKVFSIKKLDCAWIFNL